MMPRYRRSLTGLLAFVVSASAGCADLETPTSVGGQERARIEEGASATNTPDLTVLARYDKRPSITIAWAKKWIGPEGGRLDFQGFAIDVPAGAVDRVTQFSIRLPVDPQGSERVMAEFGPHQSFAVPVGIELPLSGTTAAASDATVGWWDEDISAWVDVGGDPTENGARLRTTTDHFSTYGTVDSRGDTVILSGG